MGSEYMIDIKMAQDKAKQAIIDNYNLSKFISEKDISLSIVDIYYTFSFEISSNKLPKPEMVGYPDYVQVNCETEEVHFINSYLYDDLISKL